MNDNNMKEQGGQWFNKGERFNINSLVYYVHFRLNISIATCDALVIYVSYKFKIIIVYSVQYL